jgi:hypothetical protein
MKNIFTPRFVFLITTIVIAAVTRLLPHPNNFTPVAAIALFGGACFSNKKLAFIVPLAIMFLSDVAMELAYGYGFHNTLGYVYVSFIITSAIGIYISKQTNIKSVILASLVSSVLFFLITNFGVWAAYGSPGTNGLIETYVLGIPFFRNTLIGDLLYNGVLFGTLYFAQARFPRLAKVN